LPPDTHAPLPTISSGDSMLYDSTVKTATASRSREIPLVLGNTGFPFRIQEL
jgi:hypothetical protein